MALKSLVLFSLLVAVIGVPIAEAQGAKLGMVHVEVTLYCTPDGNIGLFGKDTPPFPDAKVLLQCGNGPVLVANATTNGFGITYLNTKPLPVFPFFAQENDCKLIVNTTLSTCNSTLPSTGGLESALTLIETVAIGSLIISSFKPTGFSFNPML